MSRYQNNDHNHNPSTNFHNNNNGTQTTNSAQRGGENRNNGTQIINSAQRGGENRNNGTQTTNSAQRGGGNLNNGTQTINSAQRGGNNNIRFGGVNVIGEDTTGGINRNINNNPAWMTNNNANGHQSAHKDRGVKRRSLWVLSGTILNVVSTPTMRNMPLTLDNDLPAAVFRFGATCETEIPFSCHLDSCTAMNTGSLLLHMWIITTYPEIVESYEQFDDAVPFQPIMLDCAIPASEAEKDTGKLSAVVTYKTQYKKSDGSMMTISFGLGEAIKVNANTRTTYISWFKVGARC